MNTVVKQLIVHSQAAVNPRMIPEHVSLFNPDGTVLTNIPTTAEMIITGYSIAGAVAAVSATDTLNVALGKLEKGTSVKTTALIPITGYTIAGAAAALGATDTINVALGKLEKRIADLEAA
jgi:hypothetical protein